MKILFLDRLYHGTTGSSRFFEKLLRDHFEVELRYVDGICLTQLLEGFNSGDTLVILWQCEILAPQIRQLGFACILIPMWDGVSTLSPSFWKVLRGLPALSFSYTLHQRMQHMGLKSFLTQYAPDPELYPAVQDYDAIRFFFWNRGYGEAMDGFSAARFALGHGSAITIHQEDKWMEHPVSHLPYYVEPKHTDWFEHKHDFLQELARHNVYFAPRLNEGIGFGFLDAMACGMVVIGHNSATMNEYIKNRINGILSDSLLNPFSELRLYDDKAHFKKMGESARETVRRSNRGWLQQQKQILNFLRFVFEETAGRTDLHDVPDSLMKNLRYGLVDIDDFNRIANTLDDR